VSVTVLVADDSPAFRRALGELVAAEPGFELAGDAESAEEVVQLVESLRPDLVLLDLRIGVADGLETAAELAGLDDPPLVVVVTASDVGLLEPRAREAGAIMLDKRWLRPGVLGQVWAAESRAVVHT
jgi:DNA-binding NarL/FixJ family response regulator